MRKCRMMWVAAVVGLAMLGAVGRARGGLTINSGTLHASSSAKSWSVQNTDSPADKTWVALATSHSTSCSAYDRSNPFYTKTASGQETLAQAASGDSLSIDAQTTVSSNDSLQTPCGVSLSGTFSLTTSVSGNYLASLNRPGYPYYGSGLVEVRDSSNVIVAQIPSSNDYVQWWSLPPGTYKGSWTFTGGPQAGTGGSTVMHFVLQTPEPVGLAWIWVGGLFLRRRKV